MIIEVLAVCGTELVLCTYLFVLQLVRWSREDQPEPADPIQVARRLRHVRIALMEAAVDHQAHGFFEHAAQFKAQADQIGGIITKLTGELR
jgi:hypothetical protein